MKLSSFSSNNWCPHKGRAKKHIFLLGLKVNLRPLSPGFMDGVVRVLFEFLRPIRPIRPNRNEWQVLCWGRINNLSHLSQ